MVQKVQPKNPVIDWSNPLARGLMNFICIEEGEVIDFANKRRHPITTAGTDFSTVRNSKFNNVLKRSALTSTSFATANDDASVDFIVEKEYEGVTQTVFAAIDSQTTNWHPIFYTRFDNSNGGGFSMGFNVDNARAGIHGASWNTGASFGSANAFLVKDGKHHAYSAAWHKDKNSGACKFYRDGSYNSTSVETYTDVSNNTHSSFENQMHILGDRSEVPLSYPLKGEFAAFILHDRDLSANEVRALHENPWQIFKSRILFAPVFPYFPVDVQAQLVGETLTITLVDEAGTAVPNLTGLSWAWFDQSTVDAALAPIDQGTGETTDGSGVLEISLPNTTLTTGGTGMLALRDSTGYIYAWYRVTL